MSAEVKMWPKGKPFYVLSVDGGAIRGVYPAQVLARVEEMFGEPLARRVNLVAGTSTGSILAAAVGCEIPMARAVELYQKKGPRIFARSVFSMLKAAYSSMYSNERLLEELGEVLGERRLGEIELPLLLTASDLGSCHAHAFRSNFLAGENCDGEVPVKEAVLASCSAPMFFSTSNVGDHVYCDGCLWANNPALTAVLEARRSFGVDLADIRLLSLGVGRPKEVCRKDERGKWSAWPGWQSPVAVEVVLAFQSEWAHLAVQDLLEPEHYVRVDFSADRPLPMDDCSVIPFLLEQAEAWVAGNGERLRRFWSAGAD